MANIIKDLILKVLFIYLFIFFFIWGGGGGGGGGGTELKATYQLIKSRRISQVARHSINTSSQTCRFEQFLPYCINIIQQMAI